MEMGCWGVWLSFKLVHTGQGKEVNVCYPLLPYHHPLPTTNTHFLASLGQMLGADIEAWPVEVSDQGHAGTG